MAENSISQAVSFINDNSTMEIGLTAEGMPAVRSDIVAYHFGKQPKNVLRDIAKLRSKCPESFYRLNFERVDYIYHCAKMPGISAGHFLILIIFPV